MTAYLKTILKRNLSGPANKEPTIEVPAELTKYVGDMVSFTVKGQDPDKLDRISYGLEGSGLAERQDRRRRAASFEWPAEKIGDYEVVVAATDDGFPPKTARQTGQDPDHREAPGRAAGGEPFPSRVSSRRSSPL